MLLSQLLLPSLTPLGTTLQQKQVSEEQLSVSLPVTFTLLLFTLQQVGMFCNSPARLAAEAYIPANITLN